MNDHDLLVEVHTIVKRLDDTINGNGQPGLVTRVAALEGSGKKMVAGSGTLGAAIMVVVGAVLKYVGVV